jgi:hypothetical protein
MLMAQHDVVLTTYGVLSAACKTVCVWHLHSIFWQCLYFFGSNKVITTLTNEKVIINRITTAFFTGWIGIGLCLMKLTQSNLLKLKVPKQLID